MGLLPKYTIPDEDAVEQYKIQQSIEAEHSKEVSGDIAPPESLEQLQQLELSEDGIPEDLRELRTELIKSTIDRQRSYIRIYWGVLIFSFPLMVLSVYYAKFVLAIAMLCLVLASLSIQDHSYRTWKILSEALKSDSVNLLDHDLAQPDISRYLISLAGFLICMSIFLYTGK